jgi:hypothetical protein
MIYRAIALFLCTLVFAVGCHRVLADTDPSVPSTISGVKTVLSVFQPIAQSLQRQTVVPIVLPVVIPNEALIPVNGINQPYINVPVASDGSFENIYAFISEADRTHYEISLDATADCQGTDQCSFGGMSAQALIPQTPSVQSEYSFESDADFHPVGRSPEQMGEVELTHGIKGYFVPFVCGASCDTSKVIWDQNGYRYKFGIRYASKATMVQMANSAIENEQ